MPSTLKTTTVISLSLLLGLPISLTLSTGCGHSSRRPTTTAGLELDRVVLYRNGIGYFERAGEVDGDILTLRVRKDQINDLLKSLTVVDRRTGKAVSVSMPLDPSTWAGAALAALEPGNGDLPSVLDALRGTDVVVRTHKGRVRGRIVMVEEVENEPQSMGPRSEPVPGPSVDTLDHKLTLLDGDVLRVVYLSKIRAISLVDGDLALHLHRRLDASAGEGMFQQVAVDVRLVGARSHDVVVSYVVAAPMWKPTYRVVLPEGGKGEALLQAWAVVDNTSGEDWNKVSMSLTSGAPIAFRYDLHTPREVGRADLTERGVSRQARVALGETSFEGGDEDDMEEEIAAEASLTEYDKVADMSRATGSVSRGGGGTRAKRREKMANSRGPMNKPGAPPPPPSEQANFADEASRVDLQSLARSTQASARAKQVSGLTQFDLGDRVTVPDQTSTMVALINETVTAEQTFLYRPGGGGGGFETNPYRVVRFRNTTPFVLEPGPISIYAGGSFVGEGLSEAVGSKTSATVPFAVETEISVTQSRSHHGDEMRLTRLVRGVLHVQTFNQTKTIWTVMGKRPGGYTVLIRHPRAGNDYELRERPEGTEDLVGAYLIPVQVPADKREADVTVVEQTPSRTSLTIWDSRAPKLLDAVIASPMLSGQARSQLEPIVRLRQEIGKIDTTIDGLRRQQSELNSRAEEARRNLEAIKKDPKASALRAKLSKRLDEFTREADGLGRKIVELNSTRLERKIELEDMLQNLDMTTPFADEKKPSK